jgi:hypothetical protein
MKSLVLIFTFFVCSGWAKPVAAQAGPHGASSWAAQRGGGGGQPDPFDYNVHFELAHGEYYMLTGAIVLAPSLTSDRMQAFLMVDLKDQAWLANGYRRSVRGLYPIEGSISPWRRSEHASVKLAVRAHVNGAYDGRIPIVSLKVIPELSEVP